MMARKAKKVLPSKKLFIFLTVAALLMTGLLAFRHFSAGPHSGQGYYSCVYYKNSDHARCINTSNEAGSTDCYGYYTLKTKKIEDGINIPSQLGGATCENFMPDKYYIFSQSGKYLYTKSNPDRS